MSSDPVISLLRDLVAINSVNPNTLIFMEGVSGTADNQDGTPDTITQVPFGNKATNPNWGENLFEAGANPPAIPKDRLVFSPHTYGPSVFVQRQFMDPALTSTRSAWTGWPRHSTRCRRTGASTAAAHRT